MPPRVCAVVVLLLTISLVPLPVVEAQDTRTFVWEYHVSIPEPGSGSVHVDMTFRNMKDIVDRFTLLTLDHRHPVTNVLAGPGTTLEPTDGGVAFAVTSNAHHVSFDVAVDRPAFRDGEFLALSADDFAIFKAETFALPYTYRYYEGRPFEWESRVTLEPPPGWSAAGPWNERAPGEYVLPPGQVLPRGFVVFGPFETQVHDAGDRIVRHVRLGDEAPYVADLVEYVAGSTAYYRAVYGVRGGDHLLVVSAGAPMFRGGLGASDSVFLHESTDVRTLAHEYAHTFQLFGTDETAGQSAIWLNEGDADYHSALSLFAAGMWDPREVNEFLDELMAHRDDPEFADARLPDAAYGGKLERFAYHKGATVLRALDALLSEQTNGLLGVSDLLRTLNQAYDPSLKENRDRSQRPVTNADVLARLDEMAGPSAVAFFDRYVLGTEWPAVRPFVPEGDVGISDLVLTPARALPGEAAVATVMVHNRGTQTVTATLPLEMDGQLVAERIVTLPVGVSQQVAFDFTAPPEGTHEARVLYLRAPFHSLTSADVILSRISFSATTLRAGEPIDVLAFLENLGEQAGLVRVEVLLDGVFLAATSDVEVEGESTEAVNVPVRFTKTGEHTLVVRLITSSRIHEEARTIHIMDPLPVTTGRTPGATGDNVIPLPGGLALAGMLGVAAWVARRR